jgi:hypothetical protein
MAISQGGSCIYILEGEIVCHKKPHFYKFVNLPGLYFPVEMQGCKDSNNN